MDALNTLEIYIPVEAEVKSIPLRSLPKAVVRRIGLPLPDHDVSRKPADSPEGIWICPAVIRRKGQKLTSHAGRSGVENMENMSSVLDTEFRPKPGPLRMSIISPNRTAYEVLKDPGPGTRRSLTSAHGSSLRTDGDAVLIYRGCVYLSIRRPGRSQAQPQPASVSAVPSTSDSSCKRRKKELLNDKRPKKRHAQESRMDAAHKKRDVSTSKPVCPVALPATDVHKMDVQNHEDARAETGFHPQGEQDEAVNSVGSDMQEPGGEETESPNEPPQMDCVFNELAQAEEIARLKAQYKQSVAALGNLPLL